MELGRLVGWNEALHKPQWHKMMVINPKQQQQQHQQQYGGRQMMTTIPQQQRRHRNAYFVPFVAQHVAVCLISVRLELSLMLREVRVG